MKIKNSSEAEFFFLLSIIKPESKVRFSSAKIETNKAFFEADYQKLTKKLTNVQVYAAWIEEMPFSWQVSSNLLNKSLHNNNCKEIEFFSNQAA